MPAYDGGGPNDERALSPTPPEHRCENPQPAIHRTKSRPTHRPLEDQNLVPEQRVLGDQTRPLEEEDAKESEQSEHAPSIPKLGPSSPCTSPA